jgi:hypothetical protein
MLGPFPNRVAEQFFPLARLPDTRAEQVPAIPLDADGIVSLIRVRYDQWRVNNRRGNVNRHFDRSASENRDRNACSCANRMFDHQSVW